MSPDQNDAFLRDEYLLIQGQYEDYDRRSLTIKSWISAAVIAAIALGADASKNQSGKVWLLIAAISICIWYLEGRWKMFQYAYRKRLIAIEEHFAGKGSVAAKPFPPFQVYNEWFESYRSKAFFQQIFTAMHQDFVFLPYVPVIAVCIYMYLSK